MTPSEISKLKPEADTTDAIKAALDRIAEARVTAEEALTSVEDAKAKLTAEGASPADRRKAAEAIEDANFALEQLDHLEGELRQQFSEAEAREASEAKEAAIAELNVDLADHDANWSADIPKLVAKIERLIADRADIADRAAALGLSADAGRLRADLQPMPAAFPHRDFVLPSTVAMRNAAAEERTAAAAALRKAEAIAAANNLRASKGLPPRVGSEMVEVVVPPGKGRLVRGVNYEAGAHVLPWWEAEWLTDALGTHAAA